MISSSGLIQYTVDMLEYVSTSRSEDEQLGIILSWSFCSSMAEKGKPLARTGRKAMASHSEGFRYSR